MTSLWPLLTKWTKMRELTTLLLVQSRHLKNWTLSNNLSRFSLRWTSKLKTKCPLPSQTPQLSMVWLLSSTVCSKSKISLGKTNYFSRILVSSKTLRTKSQIWKLPSNLNKCSSQSTCLMSNNRCQMPLLMALKTSLFSLISSLSSSIKCKSNSSLSTTKITNKSLSDHLSAS